MQERDEQGETFNQDQQEMFQNPDASPGETRPPTPGTPDIPPFTAGVVMNDVDGGAPNEQLSDAGEGKV